MELKMTTEARIHDGTTENPMLYNINIKGTGNLLEIEYLNSLLTKQVKVEPEVKPANGGQLSIRIFRDDNLQGFAAYHAQDENETKTILMNVYATFAASVENDIDAKEFIIQNLMHEFGHALEEYYQKEFDEDFIEKAVQSYFDKYHPDSRLSV